MKVRILIADDHKMFRDGIRALLRQEPDFEIVGEAENGQLAVTRARKLQPDVVIMDISMPELNGVEATRKVLAETPTCRVIALSMHADRRFVLETLRAGAAGYVLKDSPFSELVQIIRSALAGEIALCRQVRQSVISDYVQQAQADGNSVFEVLSPREREVLQLLAEGASTKGIAAQLHVSAKTIETHRKQIMDKLEIRSIAELTKYAIREGLTPLD